MQAGGTNRRARVNVEGKSASEPEKREREKEIEREREKEREREREGGRENCVYNTECILPNAFIPGHSLNFEGCQSHSFEILGVKASR